MISISDGPLGDGSGIPYTYLTPLDFTSQDISVGFIYFVDMRIYFVLFLLLSYI